MTFKIESNLDCLIVGMPPLLPNAPPYAVASLVAIARNSGYQVQGFDFNIQLWRELRGNGVDFSNNHHLFYEKNLFSNFYFSQCKNMVEKFADSVFFYKPKSIALSLLSFQAALFSFQIIRSIRSRGFTGPIIIGGAGQEALSNLLARQGDIGGIQSGKEIQDLLVFLSKIAKPKRTTIGQMESLADYSDFDFSLYRKEKLVTHSHSKGDFLGGNTLYVSASIGCVRNCGFCDVRKLSPKLSLLSLESLKASIESSYKKYGVTNFIFTDSVINGSMPHFRKLCEILKQINVDDRIRISACFIVRKTFEMSDSDFELMKAAGFRAIIVGVETGSEKVRKDMNKGYTGPEFNYLIDRLRNFDIQLISLMMVGYPTETTEDFFDTLNFLKDLDQRGFIGVGKTMPVIEFAKTTYILHGTPLADQIEQLEIQNSDSYGSWHRFINYTSRSGHVRLELNSPEVREARAFMFNETLKELGVSGFYEEWMALDINRDLVISKFRRCSTSEAKTIRKYLEERKSLLWDLDNFFISQLSHNSVLFQDLRTGKVFIFEDRYFRFYQSLNQVLSEGNYSLVENLSNDFINWFAYLIKLEAIINYKADISENPSMAII